VILQSSGLLYTADVQPFAFISDFESNVEGATMKDFLIISDDILVVLTTASLCFWLWKDAKLIKEVMLVQVPEDVSKYKYFKVDRYDTNALVVNVGSNIYFYHLQKEIWYEDAVIKIESEETRGEAHQQEQQLITPERTCYTISETSQAVISPASNILEGGSMTKIGGAPPKQAYFDGGFMTKTGDTPPKQTYFEEGSMTKPGRAPLRHPNFEGGPMTKTGDAPPKQTYFEEVPMTTTGGAPLKHTLFRDSPMTKTGGAPLDQTNFGSSVHSNIGPQGMDKMMQDPQGEVSKAQPIPKKALTESFAAFNLLEVRKDGSLLLDFCFNDNEDRKRLIIYGPQ
jgi:hypothetical protein